MLVEASWQRVVSVAANRLIYRGLLCSVRVIPVLVAGIYVLNTVLSYFGIDWEGFSYLVQLLFISFMYLASKALRFCSYHRIFIHYIAIVLVLNVIDYHWGLPISDRSLYLMYATITGLGLFIALYLHQKEMKRRRKEAQ